MSCDIAIVGMGCMFPEAEGLEEFWRNVQRGRDCIKAIPATHWRPEDYFDANPKAADRTYARRGGFLRPYAFNPMDFGITPSSLDATDSSQLLSMVVAHHALSDAGYGPDRTFDRDRTSVVMGVTGTLELVIPLGARLGHPIWRRALKEAGVADEIASDVVERIAASYVGWQENSFPGLLGNVVAGRIANRFDLGGTNCVVDAACASSLSALHLAMLELQHNKADMVITGGVDAFNDIFMYMCFSKTPALSPTGDARPFASDADGTILGEGIGALVLKRLDDARRDGDRVWAVIKAMGTASDGKGQAIYAPSAKGQVKCLERAYREAQIAPATIELLEGHGTGTKVGDAVELKALSQVYGPPAKDGSWCAIGSVKAQIGHTKAAAGVAGIIKATMALAARVLPPAVKIQKPAEVLENSPFHMNLRARPWLRSPLHPRRAAVSAFGFGGSNFHCVLEEAPDELQRQSPPVVGDIGLWTWSKDSRQGLAKQIQEDLAKLTAARSEGDSALLRAMRDLSATRRRQFSGKAAHRLCGAVQLDSAKLDLVLDAIGSVHQRLVGADGAESWRTPDGFSYDSRTPGGKVAVLFPGQGSQYPGMLQDLMCLAPQAQQILSDGDQTWRELGGEERLLSRYIYPEAVFSEEEGDRQLRELTDTRRAQPALGATSLGAWRWLAHDFGLGADFMAGHSFGELTALCAAGWIAKDDLHRMAIRRGALMASDGKDRGGMLAVAAARADVARVIEEAGLDVTIANDNAPRQVVVGGTREALASAEKALSARGFIVKALRVSAAFHSPLVADANAPWQSFLDAIAVAPNETTVYANCTARPYERDDKRARQLLAQQMASPVLFTDLVQNMYAEGARVFLEVGPGHTLSRLTRQILEKVGSEVRIIALDESKGANQGALDAARFLAAVASTGTAVDVTAWDASHQVTEKASAKPTMSVLVSGANTFRPKPAKPPRQPAAAPSPQSIIKAPLAFDTQASHSEKSQLSLPVDAKSATTFPTAVATPPRSMTSSAGTAMPQTKAPSTSQGQLAGRATAPSTTASLPLPGQTPPVSGPGANGLADVAQASALTPGAPSQFMQQAILAMTQLQQNNAELHRQYLSTQAQTQRMLFDLIHLGTEAPATEPKLAVHDMAHLEPSGAASSPVWPAANAPLSPSWGTTMPTPAAQAPADPAPSQPRQQLAQPVMPSPIAAQPFAPSIPASSEPARPNGGQTLWAQPTSVAKTSTPAPLAQSAKTPAHTPAPAAKKAPEVASSLIAVVAEKTGYPSDMLNLAMNLEADLGIDSIKRVEIFADLQARLPSLTQLSAEDLTRFATLQEIVDHVQKSMPTGEKTSAAHAFDATIAADLLSVVADKTGYPTAMLNLGMNLEADLGIDSIKRVEIFAELQSRLPSLTQLSAEDLTRFATLQEIVDQVQKSVPTNTGGFTAGASVPHIASDLLNVVADKTGYPTAMLNLGMNLEADLGIDSIKRVEIFAELQSRLPSLTQLSAEDLTRFATLQEIVDHLQNTSSPAQAPLASAKPPAASPSDDLTSELLAVIADKTGYPSDMLTLDMRLEADLGIDSIKRVEIFAALAERIPAAASMSADQLSQLATLGEILTAIAPEKMPAIGAPASAQAKAPSILTTPAPQVGSEETGANVALDRYEVVLTPLALDTFTSFAAPSERQRVRIVAAAGDPLAVALAAELGEVGLIAEHCRFDRAQDKAPDDLFGLILVAPTDAAEDATFHRQAFGALSKAAAKLTSSKSSSSTPRSIFATVTRAGGNFLLSDANHVGDLAAARAVALAGLAKTAAIEWPDVASKAIDLDAQLDARDGARRIVQLLLQTSTPVDAPVEIGITAAGLWTPTLARVPQVSSQGAHDEPLAPGDLVVVTGGARGVTFAISLEMARTWGTKLLLLGRSPLQESEPSWLATAKDSAEIKKALLAHGGGSLSPKELQRAESAVMASRELRANLAALSAAGIAFIYRSVDVRDQAAMSQAILEAQTIFGPVRGVVHGAGILADRTILDQTEEQFADVYETKLRGLDHTLAAIDVDSLKMLALFSSTTARLGRKGQVAYCVANEALNKSARHFRRKLPRARVAAFGWGPWAGGMVTSGLAKLFAQENIGLIPLTGGAEFFLRELRGGDATEILVLGGGSNLGGEPLERAVFELEISTERLPVLKSHILDGRAVVPAALLMEWIALSATHAAPGLRFAEIEDFRVYKGIVLSPADRLNLIIHAGELTMDTGSFHLPIRLRSTRHDGHSTLHAGATVRLIDPSSAQSAGLAPAHPALPRVTADYDKDASRFYAEDLFHGPMLRGIERVLGCSEAGISAVVRTNSKPTDWYAMNPRSDWLTQPLALDCCFQMMILWSRQCAGAACLPTAVRRYEQLAPIFPEENCEVRVTVRELGKHKAVADMEMIGTDGQVVARVTGYEATLDAGLDRAFRHNQLESALQ